MPTDPTPTYVLAFTDPAEPDLGTLGGKGANLARLARAGFPVPPGFTVSALAYREFVGAELSRRILARLEGVEDPAQVEARAADVRAEILRQPVPEPIAEAIRAAYRALGAGARVAVRSSATAEDLPEASFAGQQDTYLNVRGEESVVLHVRRCWASLWTARAVAYRAERGFDHAGVLLAVVVQEMVAAEVAGVLFTADPVSGRRDETVINASWGLGEAVVGGLVTPDTYVVRPAEGRVVRREVARKDLEVAYADDEAGDVVTRNVPPERAAAPVLADAEAVELADLGGRVAATYGAPQDIEWAREGGRSWLLQSRPITTLGPAPEVAPGDDWTRAMFVEIFPDALSPAFASVIAPILARMLDFTFRALGHPPPEGVPAVEVFYHQPYFNRRYIREALADLPPETRERLAERIANPFTEHPPQGGARSPADVRLLFNLLRALRRVRRDLPGVTEAYERRLAALAALDMGARTDAELVGLIVTLVEDALPPLVDYDFLLIASLGFLHRLTDGIVAGAGVPEPAATQAALRSGMTGNLNMQANKALWRLAQAAREVPGLPEALLAAPDDALPAVVGAAPGAEAFRASLGAFLVEYGHREVRMDVVYPTWGEDPAPVLGFVRAYLAAGGVPDPAEGERRLYARRRAAAAEVEVALGRSVAGRLRRPIFRWAVDQAAALGSDRDTMHYHITASFPVFRRILGELGRRLVARGVLAAPAEVYFLGVPDMAEVVRAPRPMADEAARRRRAWERDRRRPWPLEIRDGEEVYADTTPVLEDGALRGVGGSPGRATGRVRVVRGPEDFGRLRPGEVLVAPMTNPAWTPLFAVAGAVVTEVGGVLSHGAIVAREYGIPAVMGVHGATTQLTDGQVVTVDGVRGTVTLDA